MSKTADMNFNRAALMKFETESLNMKPKRREFDLNDSVMSPVSYGSPIKRRMEQVQDA
jgi:hypothetical protein